MGLELGNVDILVHFLEKKGDPTMIQNVDLDRFSMFDATDSVNVIIEDLRLPLCHPFILWFWCNGSGKILPVVNDNDMLLMFSENKNCLYIHMYVTRSRNEFWKEPINVCLIESALVMNKAMNELVDQNVLNGSRKETVSELVGFVDELAWKNGNSCSCSSTGA
ncbi:hypothetical protein E2542_SST30459 [Spatholobus suberectus]|nr:hypothetical protein E2542_SST30459 [Spatholobus suberectus]